jgi:hypothetical protein
VEIPCRKDEIFLEGPTLNPQQRFDPDLRAAGGLSARILVSCCQIIGASTAYTSSIVLLAVPHLLALSHSIWTPQIEESRSKVDKSS